MTWTRREFLKTSAIGVAAVGVRPSAVGRPPSAVRLQQAAAFELDEVTIAQLQDGMRSGKWSAVQLCERYLGRVADLDRRGPSLRSFIETNPQALDIARALDAERRDGRVRGPLHGVPIVLKDNIDTADRLTTTAGSLALEGSTPTRDASVAQRLRAAGAVVLGKANMSEWANFRSTRSSSGWSGRGGQCLNPYALDRSPCGSSSGTGAAIAANCCAVGVGTETDGSVVCPAAATALVGIKPTLGLVSRAGIIPIAHSQDTAGPMCRTVTDAAHVLAALSGPDPRDPATARAPATSDYARALDPAGLRGARIGVARAKLFGYSPATDRVMEAALTVLRDAGAVLVDPADIPHVGEYDETEFTVLLYEFKADLAAYLATLGPSAAVKTLPDLIAFNERNREREMPYFGQEILTMAQEKGSLTDTAYTEALAKNLRLSRAEGIDAVMDKHRLDAIVAPTGNPAWPIDLVNGDHFLGGSSTPPAVAGYPHVTVPAGYVRGLPVGLSFIGRAWSEATLIKLAFAYEQATHHRRPPTFRPTADLMAP